MQLKPRDTQTYVKHFIIDSYLKQWGGIIGYGLRRHGYKMHLVYVDGYTSGYTFAFYLLDPYGPKGIPFDIVSCIISQQRTDVMITFPYQDLHKKTGILLREEAKPVDQALVDNYSMMFGGEEWIEIYHEAYSSTADNDERKRIIEEVLVKHYQERLQSVDEKLVVKNVGLQFPDKERTMFYLFLTTHDPTGALKLNEVLYEGKLKEHALRWEYRHAKERAREREIRQMSLFETAFVPVPSSGIFERQVDIAELADKLYDRFNGRTVLFRDILQSQANHKPKALVSEANTFYYVDDIKKALTKLKREYRAEYAKLDNWNRQIKFRPKVHSK